ncbi:hypothetical protein AB6A40_008216 [Gnathostoma spinigerum]|uniref:Uncharacterized protein n=1 Tax=Gnathostoma spinigerum TaxID=75299 RepID=A0ABD6EQT1_9BILA
MGNKSSSHAASYHANASRVPPQSVPPYFGSASPRVPPQNVPPYFGSTSPSAPPILPSSHPLCTAINPAVIQHGQPLVPPPFHGSMNSVHRIGLNGIDSGYVTGPTDIEHWKSQACY